jgi:hypothetical protein
MQEVGGRALQRIGHAARRAMQDEGARAGLAERLQYLVERDSAAIRSALDLASGDPGADGLRARADALVGDLEERARLELQRLGQSMAAPAGGGRAGSPTVVPTRAKDSVAPGVVGLSFDETAALVEAMHAEDPHVNWETLRIFGDELWNLADGRRTLDEIATAACLEFGFAVSTRHFESMAQGLQKAGYFRLDGA